MKKNAKVLWIDLEMTGLDPEHDRILEVAAIATDWDFNEVATFESAVKVDEELVKKRMVVKFWEEFTESRDGLIKQNLVAIDNAEAVEAKLIDFVKQNFAQELEKVYPEMVNTDSEGFKSVNYNELAMVKIKYLEDKVARLEAQVGRLLAE